MAQVALQVMDIVLGAGVIHRPPATVRLPPTPAPRPRPRLEVVFGKTIQGRSLFHNSITHLKKNAVVRPPSPSPTKTPPPAPPCTTEQNQRPGSTLVSIQGLLIAPVPVRRRRRRSQEAQQQQPSKKEIWDSVQRLLGDLTPAVLCRPLSYLPLAARIAAGDPTAAAALVVAGSVVAACQSYLQVVPYTNRVQLIFHYHPTHEEDRRRRIREEFEFQFFKATNARRIFRPNHYQSDRVRRLTAEIVGAIGRGLAMISSKQQGTTTMAPPHTRHLDGIHWEVIIAKDKECNAYIHPSSGKIVIFEGLLQRFKRDAEIAAVIAHEVGHVVQRHSAEWLSTSPFSRTASLSRRLEAEADYIGIMLLAAAGYDPRAAPKVWEKFAAAERKGRYYARCSTHPSPEKRAKLLSECKVMGEALRLYREVTASRSRTGEGFRLNM